MKKPISIITVTQTLIMIVTAGLLFSSCIIVNPDDDFTIERPGRTTEVTTESKPQTTSTPSKPVTYSTTHKIICRNETSQTITDWCVKKDNTVTFANSSFNRSIRPGKEDMIPDLKEGYYVVYFSFENDEQLQPWEYRSSESIYLNQDVTYCLYERTQVITCRSANAEPQFYLAGSDGSEINLITE